MSGQRRAAARVLFSLALLSWTGVLAFEVPPAPPRFVYDGANVLSAQEQQRLEERLLALDRESGVQVAVAILPSLEGESIDGASLKIAEAWKPGHAGKDDGVVLAVFMAERRVRIEVGYGLEGNIPDVVASRIIREQIVPAFRAGRVFDGLERGVEAIAAAATGKPLPPPSPAARTGRPASGAPGLGCVMAMFVAMFLLALRRAARPRVFGSRGRISPVP